MLKHLSKIFASVSEDVKKRLFCILLLLLIFNGSIWILILVFSRSYPLLLGLAALSFGFGLRHAVDADHIAAIDNTTRKLMHDGQRPVAVGFFFSLGHSLVVIALSIAVAISASFVQHNLPAFKEAGSLIGTTISSLFLLVIGLINLLAFIEIFSVWRGVIKGKKPLKDEALEEILENRGFIIRILKPLLKTLSHSHQMFIVGFLFGLGFDTATEIGLLSISAATSVNGLPIWMVILLPLAFTAGMTLVDTLDGILMLGAYGWAYVKPIRKLYYNMNITFISVVTALFIGGVEGLKIISEKTGINGSIFGLVNKIEFNHLGYFIIGAFLLSWIISIAIYKIHRYDLLDK